MNINITGIRGIPAKHGGFETFAELLSIYLRDKSWNITVYCQTKGCRPIYTDSWNGIRRVNIPVPFNGPVSTIIFDLLSVLHICIFSRSLTLVLGYNTAIFSIFYRLFGIRSVMNMDGIEWKRNKWGFAAKTWLRINERLGCKLSNHLIADHDEIKNHLISHHTPKKISTIPYGAYSVTQSSTSYLTPYNLHPNEYYLVVARPEPENSILEIVTAFVQSRSSKKLVLLGDYNNSVSYQANVLLAANDRVIFPGAIYSSVVVQALRFYCFAYIHGHTVGGTNPSLVEAMGAGCPIFAHGNRFNRGVCLDAALYFSQIDDLKNLIDTTTDESVNAFKRRSYARFEENYTLDSVHTKYINLLSELLTT